MIPAPVPPPLTSAPPALAPSETQQVLALWTETENELNGLDTEWGTLGVGSGQAVKAEFGKLQPPQSSKLFGVDSASLGALDPSQLGVLVKAVKNSWKRKVLSDFLPVFDHYAQHATGNPVAVPSTPPGGLGVPGLSGGPSEPEEHSSAEEPESLGPLGYCRGSYPPRRRYYTH